jgi:glycosyltransferase involved in cell wall biosynthesis
MEIHQLLPGLHPNDAISNDALALRRLLRSWGHRSQIYAVDRAPALASECEDYRSFPGSENGLAVYHYSLGCAELTDLFRKLPGRRLLLYHNITPPHYLEPYNPPLARACLAGRAALGELTALTDLALADSAYNCQELSDYGFAAPRVLPLLVDFAALDRLTPCPRILKRFEDSWTNFLFVGRIAPHKRQDDLLRVFAYYQTRIDRRSRLFLVGSAQYFENYLAHLDELARQLEIEDHVYFTGQVRADELAAYYRLADVFLCLSEHEGVCVPLLEAMHYRVPIVAFAAAAVPETLGDAGLLVTRKDYAGIAEAAYLVHTDRELRAHMVRQQECRLADFRPEPVAQRFRSYLDELL